MCAVGLMLEQRESSLSLVGRETSFGLWVVSADPLTLSTDDERKRLTPQRSFGTLILSPKFTCSDLRISLVQTEFFSG